MTIQKIPIAVTEHGRALMFPYLHMLAVGQTGSGKGSVWWSTATGFREMHARGEVLFYGIDPKRAEFKGLGGGIFEEVAHSLDEASDLLARLVGDLEERQQHSGRHFKPSKETPWVIVGIDELLRLLLDTDTKRRKRTEEAILSLLSQGRSDGFLVVGMVQIPQKEALGLLRSFFAYKFALRLDTASEVDIVLGPGAVENGADAHLIIPATPANDYATAGIGYAVLEGEPAPVKIRFPYTSDDYIETWNAECRRRRAAVAEATDTEAMPDSDDTQPVGPIWEDNR